MLLLKLCKKFWISLFELIPFGYKLLEKSYIILLKLLDFLGTSAESRREIVVITDGSFPPIYSLILVTAGGLCHVVMLLPSNLVV